jgi:hypothetical protein
MQSHKTVIFLLLLAAVYVAAELQIIKHEEKQQYLLANEFRSVQTLALLSAVVFIALIGFPVLCRLSNQQGRGKYRFRRI